MTYTIVNSVDHLKQLCTDNPEEFFISLGVARSSKRIEYSTQSFTFDVYNEIDDTWQEDLTESQLKSQTNIVEAIEKNSFYKY